MKPNQNKADPNHLKSPLEHFDRLLRKNTIKRRN